MNCNNNRCVEQINLHDFSGKMIVFDGIDGAGKSTHLAWLVDWLREYVKNLPLPLPDRSSHIDILVTREPGGTEIGEILRQIILTRDMGKETEALLLFAARQQHLSDFIFPALRRGDWVISDRFSDSTFAYQGFGKGVNLNLLAILESYIQCNWIPDLTILFDLPVDVAMDRRLQRRDSMDHLGLDNIPHVVDDRFESENKFFFERVREGYLQRALNNPDRYVIIDATQNIQMIRHHLLFALKRFL